MIAAQARENPYIGLRPFEREDSLYFFGRRGQTSALLERLKQNRFLAVVGGSGCGKSSLIRAGLIPALFGGFLIEQRDRWRVAILKPGDAPLSNLAHALARAANPEAGPADVQSLQSAMAEDQVDGIAGCLQDRLASDTNLLVLVDQFEEIFSFRGSEDDEQLARLNPTVRRDIGQKRAEAANFVELMLAMTQLGGFPAYVVLTMRSDFMGDCDVFYGLPEAMNSSRYLVPRLTRQQLRDAVEGPARLSGVEIEPRLVDTVLNDLGGRSDQLPVLQHALLRTWSKWNQTAAGPMDLTHYRAAGGLQDALSKHADEAIREEDLAETAKIFKCLTGTDPNQRRIRRPAKVQELIAVCDGKAAVVNGIIARFNCDGRCFLVQSKARDGDTRIDISHESLIRQWPKLRDWIDEERDSRDQYLDLLRSVRGKKALLQNPDLQVALHWREKNRPTAAWAGRYSTDPGDFGAAMQFLDDSRKAVVEAELEKKRVRTVFRTSLGIVMVLLLFATVLAIRETVRAHAAETQAQDGYRRAKSAEDVAQKLRQQTDQYASVIEKQLKQEADQRRPIRGEPVAVRAGVGQGLAAGAGSRNSERIAQSMPNYARVEQQPLPTPPPPQQQQQQQAPQQEQQQQARPPIEQQQQQVQQQGPIPSPVTLTLRGRQRSITYRNVSLDGQGNSITISPGQAFTISFQWQGSVPNPPDCPSCIVQIYYGMDHKVGGQSKCFVSDILGQGWSKSGDVKGVLTAPSAKGIYYITQTFTLDYSCNESAAQQSNNRQEALASVIVQ